MRRSSVTHEKWLANRHQPVLRLDSASSQEALVAEVLRWEPETTIGPVRSGPARSGGGDGGI